MLYTTTSQPKDFYAEVAKGNVPGHSVINKFGISATVTTATDPQDIWEFGGTYTYTANTGATYYFSSSDNTDTQTITYRVLTVDSNNNWNEEIFTQNLVGQTKTALAPTSGDPIVRIIRAFNSDSTDLAGTLYIYEDDTVTAGVPDTDSKVRATVSPQYNQTQVGLFTIPTGYVGFIIIGQVGINYTGSVGAGTNFATVSYYSRLYNGVFQCKKTLSLVSAGNTFFTDEYKIPGAIPSRTDVKPRNDEVTEDMAAFVDFQIMLVEEEYLSDEFLDSIGQVRRVT